METPIFDLSTAHALSNAELAERLFSGRYRFIGSVTAWKNANEQRYEECRTLRVVDGKLGPTARQEFIAKHGPKPEKALSAEQLAAREAFSEARCRELLINPSVGSKDNAGELAEKDPQSYRRLRIAAVSYGLLPDEPSHHVTSSAQRTPRPETPQPTKEESAGLTKENGNLSGTTSQWTNLFLSNLDKKTQ